MPLPVLSSLQDWEETRTALHQSLQVLRSTRLLGVDPLPNSQQSGTLTMPYGATTGPLKFGGQLLLDFTRLAVIYQDVNGTEVFSVPLLGNSQGTLFDAVFVEFVKAGHTLNPDRSKVQSETPFKAHPHTAIEIAGIMWRLFTTLARFRARLNGQMSPVILWPHGFDLSFLWFAKGSEESKDPHLNFGFSPFTPDVGQPYVYFYAFPAVAGLDRAIPQPWRWHTAWSNPGGVLAYEQFANESDPESFVEQALDSVYRVASGKM